MFYKHREMDQGRARCILRKRYEKYIRQRTRVATQQNIRTMYRQHFKKTLQCLLNFCSFFRLQRLRVSENIEFKFVESVKALGMRTH